jgi:hypothetical protein
VHFVVKDVKFTLQQTTKEEKRSRGIALLFLTSVLDGLGGWSTPSYTSLLPGM